MTLSVLDWAVVGTYLLVTAVISVRARLGQKTQSDYFLAGRRTHWLLIGMSMYASLFSTVSFVAMPGEGYSHGMMLSLQSIGYAVFTPLAAYLFLRFFYNTSSFTAYEYLERRYDLNVRTLGAVVFLISRALGGAIVLYAAAKVCEPMLGWSPALTIVVVGVTTTAYSFLGGLRAIILTESLQALVILGGLMAIVYKLSSLAGFDYAAIWHFAAEHDHTYGGIAEPSFWSLDPHLRYTVWTWFTLALVTPLTHYGTDQLVVQRVLASRSYGDARKAILLKAFGGLPFSLLFYFSGVLLFYYFHAVTTPPVGVKSDGILGFFINHHMPSPLPGLIAAALLSAVMSSLEAIINSLATVLSVDILQRRGWISDSTNRLSLGRRLTAAFGVLTLLLATLMTYGSDSVESSLVEVSVIWTGLWGVLLVIVAAGIFTKWATARGATCALILGVLVNLYTPWALYYGTPEAERISFIWVGLPGWLVAFVAVVVISLFDSRKTADLTGLTWRTSRVPEAER